MKLLVLVDLDNTLIDADYHLTTPEENVRGVVHELAERDVHVGLCSDSAVVTLRQWADRLGLSGPIVAERGAVVWDPARQAEYLLDDSEAAWFEGLRGSFLQAAIRRFPSATFLVGDATRFVKEWRTTPALAHQFFAVNGFRKASFSFFACCPSDARGVLEPDPELLEGASQLLSGIALAHGRDKGDLFWDENVKRGILIVHALATEKRRGVAAVIERFSPDQTVMIGDGMSDFLDLPSVAQYAVGNADPSYKARASFIAQRSLTEGVIDCLRQCL